MELLLLLLLLLISFIILLVSVHTNNLHWKSTAIFKITHKIKTFRGAWETNKRSSVSCWTCVLFRPLTLLERWSSSSSSSWSSHSLNRCLIVSLNPAAYLVASTKLYFKPQLSFRFIWIRLNFGLGEISRPICCFSRPQIAKLSSPGEAGQTV